MANIIELPKISHLFCIGDIHGEFSQFAKVVMHNCKKNSCIFVCGDCGFGFNKVAYYEQELKKLNDALATANKFVVFVRGNHDDPSYFFQKKLSFSNLILVPDYTIVKAKKKNILCIGGGISIDRIWLKQQEIKTNKYKINQDHFKKLYWEDEEPIYNDTLIDEFKEMDINIDIVVSHAAPDFAFPTTFLGGTSWFRADKNLKQDTQKERETMTKIFQRLIDNGNHIVKWVYGHYHTFSRQMYHNIEFVCNNCDFNLYHLEQPPITQANDRMEIFDDEIFQTFP